MIRFVTSRLVAVSLLLGWACLGCGDEFERAPDQPGGFGPVGSGASGGSASVGGAGSAEGGSGGGGPTGSGGAGGSGGEVGCEPGLADCDGDASNGCETNTTLDAEHCGACSTKCHTECVTSICNDPVQVAGGAEFTCAVRGLGDVYCWGDNEWGNLGDGDTTDSYIPKKVQLPSPAKEVVTGRSYTYAHACALLQNGELYCWGCGSSGQVGNGSTEPSVLPNKVDLPSVSQVSAGSEHTCAVTTQNDLYCWGSDAWGPLGVPTTNDQPSPVFVRGGVSQVAAGSIHTCALTEVGEVFCWGRNSAAEIIETPTLVALGGTASTLSAGLAHSCATLANGSLRCWGTNAHGELGDGTTTSSTTAKMSNIADVMRVGLGSSDSVALKVDKTIHAWGDGEYGQLGLGTNVGATTPQPVPMVTDVAALGIGGHHSCAIKNDGTLLCWGRNHFGQLGDGTTVDNPVPTAVTWP